MQSFKRVDDAYFRDAHHWAIDTYDVTRVQANRWFVACLITAMLLMLSLIALLCLLPLKTLVPMLIHHNTTTGEVWITKPKTPYIPETDAQIQADIVRYIVNRESYTAADIQHRFHLVRLLNSTTIQKHYADEQSNNNAQSPVNTLGEKGYRTVRIEDIVFIDKQLSKEVRHVKQPSTNLAKVDFITTTTLANGTQHTTHWVATIGWEYRGLPSNQTDVWDNWNGFTVTTYRIDPKNITPTLSP